VRAFLRLSPSSILCIHVQYVVTEHGAVDLSFKTDVERADPLIGIAHPDFRAELGDARVRRAR
jgi:acyl-CoA hydrolase